MLPKDGPPIARQVPKHRDPALVQKDLDALLALARDEGAHQAVVIRSGEIVSAPGLAQPSGDDADPRNRSEHWPVRYPLDSLTQAIRAFKQGVFFSVSAPEGMPPYGQGWIEDPGHRQVFIQAANILTAVESDAFYRGYHLASGYGAGNCRSVFCHNEKRCNALLNGRACIHPYKARPSLAAAGLDGPAMARKLGFSSGASDLFGLVMVL